MSHHTLFLDIRLSIDLTVTTLFVSRDDTFLGASWPRSRVEVSNGNALEVINTQGWRTSYITPVELSKQNSLVIPLYTYFRSRHGLYILYKLFSFGDDDETCIPETSFILFFSETGGFVLLMTNQGGSSLYTCSRTSYNKVYK